MRKSTLGFILIVMIGVMGILAWKFVTPWLFRESQLDTSDATKGQSLRIGGDNYLGYWFMVSPELRKQAARRGLNVQFTDDGGAYADRLAKFAKREYDCIVLPINSYLQHGAEHQFPGVIVAAISESRGADGIVGFKDRLPTGKIADLNDDQLRIVYTGDSPSAFLLDLTISDFDLDLLRGSDQWRQEANGSADVLKRARAGEGDVFVLWEPDLSKALEIPGMSYIWGSDRFSGYIVDVFVFHREFLQNHPQQVGDFLDTYFTVQRLYANNRPLMIKEMARANDLKNSVIESQLEKIDWLDINENAQRQFGIPANPGQIAQEGVINTMIACTDVMIRSGDLQEDPLKGNPYLLTNRQWIEQLSKTGIRRVGSSSKAAIEAFREADDETWARMIEVGTFRIEPITFQSWNNLLTDEGKARVDKIAALLTNNYPNYRILVRGHTGPGGDEPENKKLSQARAAAVRQYLLAVHSMDENRLKAEGAGSSQPTPRKKGESMRAYQYRLPRVEFIALEENRL